jgi:hypothetical protein
LKCSGVVNDNYVHRDERRRGRRIGNFGGLAGPAIVSNVIGGGNIIQFAAVVKLSSCRCSRRTYDTHSMRQAFRTIHN